mmetsp:Transcript_35704/g.80224  ORF Transcript_35704/g.80224 Transcript_35704/m.80224 type:complete len:346 (+) Transcript_35704:865-1902(+)
MVIRTLERPPVVLDLLLREPPRDGHDAGQELREGDVLCVPRRRIPPVAGRGAPPEDAEEGDVPVDPSQVELVPLRLRRHQVPSPRQPPVPAASFFFVFVLAVFAVGDRVRTEVLRPEVSRGQRRAVPDDGPPHEGEGQCVARVVHERLPPLGRGLRLGRLLPRPPSGRREARLLLLLDRHLLLLLEPGRGIVTVVARPDVRHESPPRRVRPVVRTEGVPRRPVRVLLRGGGGEGRVQGVVAGGTRVGVGGEGVAGHVGEGDVGVPQPLAARTRGEVRVPPVQAPDDRTLHVRPEVQLVPLLGDRARSPPLRPPRRCGVAPGYVRVVDRVDPRPRRRRGAVRPGRG